MCNAETDVFLFSPVRSFCFSVAEIKLLAGAAFGTEI